MKTLNCLTNGTLHSSSVHYYKTKDGRAIFAYSFENTGKYYDIVIHQHPPLRGRDSSSYVLHWLPCDISPLNMKVCFSVGKEPKTLDKAKAYCKQYSELVWNYIQTGITLNEQLLRRN